MIDIGRTEEICRQMDDLAKEDHTHYITPEEISVYRNNWWIRSNTVGSDTVPVRHRPDFKQALSTLRQLKHQEDRVHQQRWQSFLHLGGTGKNPGGILLMSITTKTYPALIDQGNLLKSDWATYSRNDSQN